MSVTGWGCGCRESDFGTLHTKYITYIPFEEKIPRNVARHKHKLIHRYKITHTRTHAYTNTLSHSHVYRYSRYIYIYIYIYTFSLSLSLYLILLTHTHPYSQLKRNILSNSNMPCSLLLS